MYNAHEIFPLSSVVAKEGKEGTNKSNWTRPVNKTSSLSSLSRLDFLAKWHQTSTRNRNRLCNTSRKSNHRRQPIQFHPQNNAPQRHYEKYLNSRLQPWHTMPKAKPGHQRQRNRQLTSLLLLQPLSPPWPLQDLSYRTRYAYSPVDSCEWKNDQVAFGLPFVQLIHETNKKLTFIFFFFRSLHLWKRYRDWDEKKSFEVVRPIAAVSDLLKQEQNG